MRTTHDQRSNCDEALEWLALELGNDATAEEREQLRHHLEHCADCREEAAALGESHRALVEHAPGPPTEAELASLRDAIAKSVANEPTRHRKGPGPGAIRWLALAAALWLAVTLVLHWSRPPEPLAEGTVEAHRATPPPSLPEAGGELPDPEPMATPPTEAPPQTRVADTRRPEPAEQPIQVRAPQPVAPQPVAPQPTPVPDPRGIEISPVATASLATAAPPAAPLTLKLVSDEPDLVIYWLVDPADTTHQENPDATAL